MVDASTNTDKNIKIYQITKDGVFEINNQLCTKKSNVNSGSFCAKSKFESNKQKYMNILPSKVQVKNKGGCSKYDYTFQTNSTKNTEDSSSKYFSNTSLREKMRQEKIINAIIDNDGSEWYNSTFQCKTEKRRTYSTFDSRVSSMVPMSTKQASHSKKSSLMHIKF